MLDPYGGYMSEDDNRGERIRKIQESALSDLNRGDLTSSLNKYDGLTIAPDVNDLVDRPLLVRFWNTINSIDGLDAAEDARRKMFSKQWAEVIASVTSDELDAASDEHDDRSLPDSTPGSYSDPARNDYSSLDSHDKNDHEDNPDIIDVRSVPVSEYEGCPVEASFGGLHLEDYGTVRGYVDVNDDVVVLIMGEDDEDNVPFFTLGKTSQGYLIKDPSLRTLTVWSSAPSGFTTGCSSSVVDDSVNDSDGNDSHGTLGHDSNDSPIDPVHLADSIEQAIASYGDHDDIATRAGKFIERYNGFNDLPLSDGGNASEDSPVMEDDTDNDRALSDIPHTVTEDRDEDASSPDNNKTIEDPVFMVPTIGRDGDHDYSIFTMIADSSGAELHVLRQGDDNAPIVSGDGRTVTIPYWVAYGMTGGSIILVVDGISSDKNSALKDVVKTLIHDNGVRVGSKSGFMLRITGHVKIFILSSANDVSRLEGQL
jgi:hypothetical protein